MKGKVFIVVLCLVFLACNNEGENAGKTPDSANGNSEVPAGEDNHVMENNVSPEKSLEPHHTRQVVDSAYSTRELKMAPTADTTSFYAVDSVKKY